MILQILVGATFFNILLNVAFHLHHRRLYHNLRMQFIASFLKYRDGDPEAVNRVEDDLNRRLRSLQVTNFAPQIKSHIRLVRKEATEE